DRNAGRHVGNHNRAASVSRVERAPARIDPERHLGGKHGAAGRFVGRSAANRERLHHGAGTAGAWAAVQGGGSEGVCGEVSRLPPGRASYDPSFATVRSSSAPPKY